MNDFNAPYRLLIDGQLVDTSARLEVINPATGAVFAHCPSAGAAELDAAVAAARRAFPAWKALGFAERAQYIAQRLAEFHNEQAADFFAACAEPPLRGEPPPFQCAAPTRSFGYADFR